MTSRYSHTTEITEFKVFNNSKGTYEQMKTCLSCVSTTHEWYRYDIVVTSYGCLKSEMASQGIAPLQRVKGDINTLPWVRVTSATSNPVLFGVTWERIVLDEAHAIKNRATGVR